MNVSNHDFVNFLPEISNTNIFVWQVKNIPENLVGTGGQLFSKNRVGDQNFPWNPNIIRSNLPSNLCVKFKIAHDNLGEGANGIYTFARGKFQNKGSRQFLKPNLPRDL